MWPAVMAVRATTGPRALMMIPQAYGRVAWRQPTNSSSVVLRSSEPRSSLLYTHSLLMRGLHTACVAQTQTTTSNRTMAQPQEAQRRALYEQAEHARSGRQERKEQTRSVIRAILTFLSWLPVPMAVLLVGGSVGSISGSSMSPTLNPTPGDKDLVLLNRYAARQLHYDVGDVVMLTSPIDPNMIICKRILAMPGDAVSISKPASTDTDDVLSRPLRKVIRIPPSHVWVEGDRSTVDAAMKAAGNASQSLTRTSRDSREYGPIPMGLITDRVDLILWPPSRFGRLPHRPGFDWSASQKAREARQRKQQIGTPGHRQAHPDDSFMTPFMDWEWNTDQSARQGMALRPLHVADVGQTQQQSGAASMHKHEHDERRAEMRRSMKEYWNSLSRGGQLGDDAEASKEHA